jgi:protein-tyrosine phosphatase
LDFTSVSGGLVSPKLATYTLRDFPSAVTKVTDTASLALFDLVIDTRPYNDFSRSHLKNAVNICIPTTLLKRNSMNVHSLLNLVNIPDVYKQLLMNKLSLESPSENDKINLLFYDSKSKENSIGLILYQTINKFLVFHDYFNIYYLDGGFADASLDSNIVSTTTSSSGNSSPVNDTASSTPPETSSPTEKSKDCLRLPTAKKVASSSNDKCLSGFVLPSATNYKIKFINSIKKNTLLPPIDTLKKIDDDSSNYHHQFTLPPNYTSTNDIDSMRYLPRWLKTVILHQLNKSIISYLNKNFTKIELLETSRLNSLISKEKKCSGNSPSDLQLKPFPRIHSTYSPTICSPSGLCPDCDKIQYEMPRGIEYGFKNRYKNIWPYEHSRVRLPGPQNSKEGSDDYFNANFVNCDPVVNSRFKYIATQNPLAETVKDFWNIINTQNVKLIINLDISKMTYLNDSYIVKLEEVYTSTSLVIKRINDEIYHFQFLEWPDFGVPRDFDSILQLIKLKNEIFNKFENKEDKNTILVHCLAGCGRTGVFITIDSLIDSFGLNQEQFLTSQSDLIYRLIQHQRTQRIAMVQNLDQYIVCYEIILHYLATKERIQDSTPTKRILDKINIPLKSSCISQSWANDNIEKGNTGNDYFLNFKQTYV